MSFPSTLDGRDEKRKREAPETVSAAPARRHGQEECPRCHGVGDVLAGDRNTWTACLCTRRAQKAQLVRDCWPSDVLRAAARDEVRRSALEGRLGESLWLRAERDTLVAHLARALRAGGRIGLLVRIASDADLATAWLARAGDKVRDEEVREAMSRDDEDRYDRLVDLVAPPALLVIQLGVKATPLKDLPGLVSEAILTRQQRGRPTWIVDTTSRPLAPGHLAYSEELAAQIAEWPQVRIDSPQDAGAAADLASPSVAPAAPATSCGPNSLVAAALAELQGVWVAREIDDRGNAWGSCPSGAPDHKYSVYEPTKPPRPGVQRAALGKCWTKECSYGAARVASKIREQGAARTPASSPGPSSQAAKGRSARQVLIELLGIGSSEPPVPVARHELERHAKLRSLEAAKQQLRVEGHAIDSVRGADGTYAWVRR